MSKSKIAPPDELRRLIGIVETTLHSLPRSVGTRVDYEQLRAYQAAEEKAFLALAETAKADVRTDVQSIDFRFWRITVRKTWDGAKIKMGGISASSTSGPSGAMTNWLNRARAELAYGEAAI